MEFKPSNTNVTETTLDSANTNFLISTDGYGGTVGIDGNVDSVSVWDSALEAVEIANLYNSGTPTDLSLLSTPPIAWYRMGDNGAYKSPQWLIPSDENKDKVSNYSYQFEGINSRQMSVGTVNVGTTNTTSMWLKRNVVSTQQTLLGGSSATFPDYYMLLFTGQ